MAKFFHNKMVNGVAEPKTSPIRHLGISKLLAFRQFIDKFHLSKNKNVSETTNVEKDIVEMIQNIDIRDVVILFEKKLEEVQRDIEKVNEKMDLKNKVK